jgi:uncharacterized protein (TIGR03437 family)
MTPPGTGIGIASVLNAASSTPGAIAPGEIIAIKGTGLGPAVGTSAGLDPATGLVQTTVAGTRVFFNNQAAPLLYVSATQINVIVPFEVAGLSPVSMQVEYQGVRAPAVTMQTGKAAPAAFTLNATGVGQALAANGDGTLNGPANPAPQGSYVTIYFTGGGLTNPPGVTGSITGLVQKRLTESISVTVGGQNASVPFAGAAPALVDGVGQLNIKLGDNTPAGPAQPLIITVAGVSSPVTATLAIAP